MYLNLLLKNHGTRNANFYIKASIEDSKIKLLKPSLRDPEGVKSSTEKYIVKIFKNVKNKMLQFVI